jgi:hypothetical protein
MSELTIRWDREDGHPLIAVDRDFDYPTGTLKVDLSIPTFGTFLLIVGLAVLWLQHRWRRHYLPKGF